jgi:hypothetical protein
MNQMPRMMGAEYRCGLACLLLLIGLGSIGCSPPPTPEPRRATRSNQRVMPGGSLPKPSLRTPGQLGSPEDPCNVARGAARPEGCAGQPGDEYVPAQTCDSTDPNCSGQITPGHHINNSTDPPADQSDATKEYASGEPPYEGGYDGYDYGNESSWDTADVGGDGYDCFDCG